MSKLEAVGLFSLILVGTVTVELFLLWLIDRIFGRR